MTSELRRLLQSVQACRGTDYVDELFGRIIDRLDALTEAKGAYSDEDEPAKFKVGQRVRVIKSDSTDNSTRPFIGQTVTVLEDSDTPWCVLSDGRREVFGQSELVAVEPAPPLASGNLAAVTAERDANAWAAMPRAPMWSRDMLAGIADQCDKNQWLNVAFRAKELMDKAAKTFPGDRAKLEGLGMSHKLCALLDSLVPDWREETDDPLAAVRGICAEKDRAWAAANETVIDMRKREVERDEARAKLAEAERERDEAKALYQACNAAAGMHERRANAVEDALNDANRKSFALGSQLTAAESELAGERVVRDACRDGINRIANMVGKDKFSSINSVVEAVASELDGEREAAKESTDKAKCALRDLLNVKDGNDDDIPLDGLIAMIGSERDEARAKLAEAEKERDGAIACLQRALEAVCGELSWAMIGSSTSLSYLGNTTVAGIHSLAKQLTQAREVGIERQSCLTAAESALAGEREACDKARRIMDYPVEGRFKSIGDALHAGAWVSDHDSRRRATTGGEKADSPPSGLCKCQGSDPVLHKHYREAPHRCARCGECDAFVARDQATTGGEVECQPCGGPCDAKHVDPPSPAAPDLELHIDAMCREAWNTETRDHDVRTLARRALKAEDRVEVLERALKVIRADADWGSEGERHRAYITAALHAQPEAGRDQQS